MKNTIVILFLLLHLLITKVSHAQSEVKISAVLSSFAFEQGIEEQIGVEGTLMILNYVYAASLSGKYYWGPNRGLDGFYTGLFVGHISEIGTGLGFIVGKKWVSMTHGRFVVDTGVGVGRTVNRGYLPYIKIDFGYRFGKRR